MSIVVIVMKSQKFLEFARPAKGALILADILVLVIACGILPAVSQRVPLEPAKPQPATAPKKPGPLVWDSTVKEITPEPTNSIIAGTVKFSFYATNVSDQEVVIDRMVASCGCTTIQMPSQPWHIAPGEHGKVDVILTYAGKFGVFYKAISIISPTAPGELGVKVNLAKTPQMARQANRAIAEKDRQAVFKGDCASCHADKAKDKMGKALYVAACGVCHESPHRATMVPNLHTLNKPTDYDYWKQWITYGKTNSLMPAFGISAGGPLTDEQIDSLAKTLVLALPPHPNGSANGRHVTIPGAPQPPRN